MTRPKLKGCHELLDIGKMNPALQREVALGAVVSAAMRCLGHADQIPFLIKTRITGGLSELN
jgi:hypothetical protein